MGQHGCECESEVEGEDDVGLKSYLGRVQVGDVCVGVDGHHYGADGCVDAILW